MNTIPILFLSFIAVVSSHVLVSNRPNHCEQVGPEVYCASEKLTSGCEAEAFCKEYLLKSPCEKGPEVYCKTKETVLSCNKEAFCLTWPNDEVIAVKIVPPNHELNADRQIFYNAVG